LVKKTVIATILITILLTASAYVVYTQYYNSSSPSSSSNPSSGQSPQSGNTSTDPSDTSNTSRSSSSGGKDSASTNDTIKVVDGAGYIISLDSSPKRILVMDGGLAEIMYILGATDLIVGRTDTVTFPPQLRNVPSLGAYAYAVSLEAILELDPDLIISSSQFGYSPVYRQVVDMGIPVYLETSDNPPAVDTSKMTAQELYNYPTRIDVVCDALRGISELVGRKGNMDAYITWAQGYNKIVKDRIAALPRDQMVTVFYEWHAYPYRTYVDMSMYQGGGINIAEQTYRDYSSTLSPEFVVEQNPSVIIALISSANNDVNDFIAAKNEVLNRPVTQNVDAVKNGRVYVCDFAARNGLRSVIGYVYFATWLQPDLFSDVNPTTVSQQLQQFGIPASGTYCY